jgi:hypothetical protein
LLLPPRRLTFQSRQVPLSAYICHHFNYGRASSSTKSQFPRGPIFELGHRSHKALFETEGGKCCKNNGLVYIGSILVRSSSMSYNCELHSVHVACALTRASSHVGYCRSCGPLRTVGSKASPSLTRFGKVCWQLFWSNKSNISCLSLELEKLVKIADLQN